MWRGKPVTFDFVSIAVMGTDRRVERGSFRTRFPERPRIMWIDDSRDKEEAAEFVWKAVLVWMTTAQSLM